MEERGGLGVQQHKVVEDVFHDTSKGLVSPAVMRRLKTGTSVASARRSRPPNTFAPCFGKCGGVRARERG
jgi:hypothetical protein